MTNDTACLYKSGRWCSRHLEPCNCGTNNCLDAKTGKNGKSPRQCNKCVHRDGKFCTIHTAETHAAEEGCHDWSDVIP